MARPSAFRQVDLQRALKAALAAGVAIGKIDIEPSGKITIITTNNDAKAPVDDFTAWKTRHAR